MKARLNRHTLLPLDLLMCPGSKLSDDNSNTLWTPDRLQGRRLDCTLGYMYVFTDCLCISERKTYALTACILPLKARGSQKFQIETGENTISSKGLGRD